MTMLRKILIANRGEIAVRIIRTCRAMGISAVAVYSDADANALHARMADEAVNIGPAPADQSYLRIDRILDAARRTGSDAIHPGYGFLSENPEFARACVEARITFIGPGADAIRLMGSKSAARKLAGEAGVPVIPGYDGDDQSNEVLQSAASKTGFPLLIKASAGGGGRGMRLVRNANELNGAIDSARREAEKAFGDGALLIEKYVERARHVEFQLLGDQHGNLIHLFERECSIQRRHQKIVEESPSPVLTSELREAMGEAAIAAARAIGYVNAGTVEFVLDQSGKFYFIEMNTRLQVEHPVTEFVTGLDLVKLQIEIAEGRPLPFRQHEIKQTGWAIEARLYAEDPDNDFLPATGFLHDWHEPLGIESLRIDTGLATGSEVGIHYDPMLAKLIAYAADRETAIRKLVYGLERLGVSGVTTNREFLIRLLEHPRFRDGDFSTDFVSDNLSALVGTPAAKLDWPYVIAATLYLQKIWQSSSGILPDIQPVFRNNPYRDPSITLSVRAKSFEVSYRHEAGDVYRIRQGETESQVRVLSFEPRRIRLEIDGLQQTFDVAEAGDRLAVRSSKGSLAVIRPPRYPQRHTGTEQESADAPMPGQVLRVLVTEGQQVNEGDPLVILEAMKIEQTIKATITGVVQSVHVKPGDVVAPGEVLINIAPA